MKKYAWLSKVWYRQLVKERPLLLVVTSSGGVKAGVLGALNVDVEMDQIWDEVVLHAPAHTIELVQAREVTVEKLTRLLIKLKPTILQFSGHGKRHRASAHGDTSSIVLTDEHGDPRLVTQQALAEMIAATSPNLRILLLNSCHSSIRSEILCRIVDAVITLNGEIHDSAAREFSAALYRGLGNGLSLGASFKVARATLGLGGYPDASLPRCDVRAGLSADDIYLVDGPDEHPATLQPTERSRAVSGDQPQRKVRRAAWIAATVFAAAAAAAAALSQVEPFHSWIAPLSSMAPEHPQRELSAPRPARDSSAAGALQALPPDGGRVSSMSGAVSPPPRMPPHSPSTEKQIARHVDAPRPRPPQPKVRVASTPDSLTDLSRDEVQGTIARHRNKLRYCYQQALWASSTATGTVTTRFTITEQGDVVSVSADANGLDSGVARCVKAVIERLDFRRSGSTIQVSYPFRFVPQQ